MTQVLADTFTGTNGAAWDGTKWTTSVDGDAGGGTPTAGVVDIQTNAGRMRSPSSSGGYGARARAISKETAHADFDVVTDWKPGSDNGFTRIYGQATGDWAFPNAPTAGYNAYIDHLDGTLFINKFQAGAETSIAGPNTTALPGGNGTAAHTYRVRFRKQGSTLKLKVWDATTTEPGGAGSDASWTLTGTDSTITAAGVEQIVVSNGSTGVSCSATFDNLTVDDLVVSGGGGGGGGGGTPTPPPAPPPVLGGFVIPNPTGDAVLDNLSELDSGHFTVLATGIRGDGVLGGCAVTAQATPNLTVAVAAGSIRIADRTYAVAATNLAVTRDPAATNPRYNIPAVQIVSGVATPVMLLGDPTAEPTAGAQGGPAWPAIPANTIVLAESYIPAAIAAVTNAYITDKRTFVRYIDEHCWEWFIEGNVTAGDGKFPTPQFPYDADITRVELFTVAGGPTGGPLIADLKRVGSTLVVGASLFSANAARPQIAAGGKQSGFVIPDAAGGTRIAAGERVLPSIALVGTTTPGADVTLAMWTRKAG